MATVNNKLARVIHIALWGSLSIIATTAPQASWAAESSVDIGTVQATTASNGTTVQKSKKKPASYQAPGKTPLKVSQPTSVVSRHFIAHNVVPTSNYDEMIQHTPSVMTIAPNGPGLMESQGMSIRGFQDGEFNVTFDGLPWGDSNDFTHHSTSYFMAHDIAQATVDRGPGTAATVGQATFGGTIALQSRNPSPVSSLNLYSMLGSWGTQLTGVEYDTGVLPQYGGAAGLLDYGHEQSRGYLTHSGLRRHSFFTKVTRPVGNNTLVTFAAMYNKLHQNVPLGATQAQINTYGANYGLSGDPTKQNYFGYNYDNIHTDFEYVDVQSQLSPAWSMDNKIYTYAYYHYGQNGLDPNGETPNGTPYGANDVPGQKMAMLYRSVGDFARFAKKTTSGTWNAGLWFDHQYNTRWEKFVDWTLGGIAYPGGPSGLAAYDRLMSDHMDIAQPYLEFAWKVSPKLTITPGVKYSWFRRTLNAVVNQGSGQALKYSKTWSSVLPAIDLHYHIRPNWVAYAQAAKGFLAPNLNTFYTANPAASDVKPQETQNFQVGTTWKGNDLSLSGDAYYINFNNKIGSRTIAGNTIFYNQGGVIYKGLEFEGTYYLGSGYSVYANASANSAKTKDTHQWIANAPKSTASLGLIYNRGPWYGSIMDKYVGSRYGDSGETQPLASYKIATASLSYTLKHGAPSWMQHARINFQVNNLFNKKDVYALAGYTGGANTPLYWTIPERSYYVSLSANF